MLKIILTVTAVTLTALSQIPTCAHQIDAEFSQLSESVTETLLTLQSCYFLLLVHQALKLNANIGAGKAKRAGGRQRVRLGAFALENAIDKDAVFARTNQIPTVGAVIVQDEVFARYERVFADVKVDARLGRVAADFDDVLRDEENVVFGDQATDE